MPQCCEFIPGAAAQLQAEATNTPQPALVMQQARQADGQQHTQATPNMTAAGPSSRHWGLATNTPQQAPVMKRARGAGQLHT